MKGKGMLFVKIKHSSKVSFVHVMCEIEYGLSLLSRRCGFPN
jgi:hypothetical protein